MTHEEVMTSIARQANCAATSNCRRSGIRSRPSFATRRGRRSGLLRVRQFTMKDSYSFDIDSAGLDVSYLKHYDTYCRIFDRCGLKYMVVEAHSGAMGGSQSHEFMVRTPAGEDHIVSCESCGYAANMEKATSKLAAIEDLPAAGDGKLLEVHTPGQKTIEEVAKFLGVSPKNKIKTLALMTVESDAKTKGRAVVVLLRGDHQLNEAKLSAVGGKRNSSYAGGGDQRCLQLSGGISRAARNRVGRGYERSRAPSCFSSIRRSRVARI